MKHLYIIVLLVLAGTVYGQNTHQAKSISQGAIRTGEIPNKTHNTYVARDKIELLPGFNSSDLNNPSSFRAEIDESLIYPLSYESNPLESPETRNLTAKAVGAIAGSIDVSPTGAAIYQIPITTPPGTAGMQPNISIAYNSQAGNGMLGLKWDIAGLSSITRTGQTVYHDGKVTPIALTNADRFLLDGQRLILKSGTYGAFGSTYATEQESFAQITALDANNGVGSLKFEVKTKEGMILEYGYTGDSRINIGNDILMWRLNKMTDPNGNYMTYHYGENEGESWIEEIRYTGNTSASLTPYNTITFMYERRADSSSAYVAGKEIASTLLLSAIKVRSEGHNIRQYGFNYVNDSFYSKLYEVTEKGSDGSEVNSTLVKWNAQSASYYQAASFYSQEMAENVLLGDTDFISDFHFADLNGDGLHDMIMTTELLAAGYSENEREDARNCVVFLAPAAPGKIYQQIAFIPLGKNFHTIHVSGPDNQGKQRFFIEEVEVKNWKEDNYCSDNAGQHVGTNQYCIHHLAKEYYLAGSNNITHINTYHSSFVHDGSDGQAKAAIFKTGNFWGPGTISYLITRRTRESDGKLHELADLNDERFDPIKWEPFYDCHFMDFDGDGVDELMLIYETGSRIYKYNQSTESIHEVFYDAGFPTKCHQLFPADFNGDGKTDLLVRTSRTAPQTAPYNWFIHISTGTGFTHDFEKYPVPFPTHVNKDYDNDLLIGDFNGDGKHDILLKGSYVHSDSLYAHYYFSSGNGTFLYQKVGDPFINTIRQQERTVDVLGYGCSGLFAGRAESSGADSTVTGEFFYYGEHRYRPKAHYVAQITDGMNNKYQIEYEPLTKGGSFYTKGNSPGTYIGAHVINYQGSLFAVSKIKTPDGIGGIVSTEYSYKDARIHYTGRGFLGFKEVTAKNSTLGQKQVATYGYDTNVFDVHLQKQELLTNSNVPMSTTTCIQNTQNLGGKRYFAYTSSVTQKDELKNVTVTTHYTYHQSGSNLGNLQYQITKYGTIHTDTIKYFYTKPSGFSSWSYNNRLERQETVSKHADDNSKYSRFEQFEYDAKGNLTKKIEDTGVVTTYSNLNACGLATRQTVTAPGYNAVATDFTYDSYKRFVVNISNELGEVSKTYDAMGALLSETDATGLVTTYQYDGFGRTIKTVTPQGHAVVTTYQWQPDGGSATARYFVQTQAPGKPTAKSIYDAAGRETELQTAGLNGTIYTQTSYNNKGQVAGKTHPYYTIAERKSVVYGYDPYGRQSTVTDRGQTTTLSYGSANNRYSITTTMPDGKTATKYYNVHGDLVQAADSGGNVFYQYHSSGQPKKITTNGAVFEMQYDAYGRQTHLADPNAGIIAYTYDGYGNLQTQKNAKNQTTSCVYDKFQRITSKTLPAGEGAIAYSYYADGAGKGKVRSIVGNNHSLSYEYGEYGRLVALTETIDDNRFTYGYEYDQYGNRTDITYPGGFRVKQVYNANGYLTTIRNGVSGQLIWALAQVTAQGQPKAYVWGKGNSVIYTYNGSFLPTEIAVSGVQTHTYNISQVTGNMASRGCRNANSGVTRTESFYYDGLDRLERIERSGQPDFELTYAPNGNISFKPDAGDYLYHPQKVHAMERIDTPSAALLAMPQQEIDYTSFEKAKEIRDMEGTNLYNKLKISYGVDQQRTKTNLYLENELVKTKYFSGSYEQEIDHSAGATRQISYIHSPFGPVAAYVQPESGNGSLYYLATDLLGSITAVVPAASGAAIEYRSYDAWGRVRNPNDWSFNNVSAFSVIDRGYTFHEHLPEFGLINMNGRMYDPIVGRFLSPDPYVQDPGSTQGFNRYSYCLNNPLKYTDPSGEFAFSVFNAIKDFFSIILTDATFKDGWTSTKNAWKLDIGLFKTDPNKNFWGRTWELFSRFTWQAPQVAIGHLVTHIQNTCNGIKSVDFYGGATVAETYSSGWGAVTLGNYIMGRRGIEADPNHWLFQHEYGHYLQSQASGLFYLQRYGIPSAFSRGTHNDHPAEQDANARALKYFNKHIDGYDGWVHGANRINGYNRDLPYNDPSNKLALKYARLRPAWHDWILTPDIIGSGIINALLLNNRDRRTVKQRKMFYDGLPVDGPYY